MPRSPKTSSRAAARATQPAVREVEDVGVCHVADGKIVREEFFCRGMD